MRKTLVGRALSMELVIDANDDANDDANNDANNIQIARVAYQQQTCRNRPVSTGSF